nr:DNA adenine methylase [Sphingomonas sp. CFBP 8760]
MGTKKLLAPRIAELVSSMAPGPFLDLFSGIAAVGTQVGSNRAIWSNDVQSFSGLLTQQRFCAAMAFTTAPDLVQKALVHFAYNRHVLTEVFGPSVSEEKLLLGAPDPSRLKTLIDDISTLGTEKRVELRAAGAHCMVATTHGGTYVGLTQAIEADSIRYAADRLLLDGDIDQTEHRWMVLALCQAIITANNSTGHFAQFLSPSPTNIHRIVRKRRMSMWSLWRDALINARPLGTVKWRRGNRTFSRNAADLLKSLRSMKRKPAVIYADPPYTSDQYSRYYHLLENIVLYDYPETASKGQYRADRFSSAFSLKSSVDAAFSDLVSAAARLPAVFVLSYPSNGLLGNSTDRVVDLLCCHFQYVDQPVKMSHLHSTMGGSKGPQKHIVEENIFVAYQDIRARFADRQPTPAALVKPVSMAIQREPIAESEMSAPA